MKKGYLIILLFWQLGCESSKPPRTPQNLKALEFLSKDMDSSLFYADLSIEFNPEPKDVFLSYFIKGYVQDERKNYREAIKLYYQALQFIPESPAYHEQFGRINLNIGRILKVNNQFENALNHYNRALNYIDDAMLSTALYNIAQVYKEMGQKDLALEYYLKVLDKARDENDIYHQTKVFNQLGVIYNQLGNYQQGREYFYEIINFTDSVNEKYIATAYHNIAFGFKMQFKFHKAEEFYLKAIARNGKRRTKFLSYMDLGEVYLEMSRNEEAMNMLEESFEFIDSIEPKPEYLAIYSLLGEVAFSLGNDDAARKYLKKHRESLNEYDEVKTSIKNEFISNNFSKSLDDYWDSHGKKVELLLDK